MQTWKKLSLGFAIFALVAVGGLVFAKPQDKVGSSHLTFDEKQNLHFLNLCAGQRWSMGPEKPFKSITTRSSDPVIAEGSFLSATEVNAINLSILGKTAGVTHVFFDFEIIGLAKTMSEFEVTVSADCGAQEVPRSKDKKNETIPAGPIQWDWPLPMFKGNTSYSGDGPECLLSDGDFSPSYDTNLVPVFAKIDGGNYMLQLGEDGVWTAWLQGGILGVRSVVSTDKNVAEGKYYAKNGSKVVVRTKKPGTSVVMLEVALQPPDFKQYKRDIVWKKISIAVHVLPTKSDPTPQCTDEIQAAPAPESLLDRCPVSPPASSGIAPAGIKVREPNYTAAPPTGLTPKEKELAKSLVDLAQEDPNRTSLCTQAAITRQSKKIAHAFYKVPLRTEMYASCVDCAQDVVDGIVDALADEEVSCFKITKVGRQEPVFKIALHTVAAIGPACTTLNDDWIVLDTWFWAGNVPVLPKSYEIFQHRYRVSTFEKWKYENNVDWGAGSHQNLPEKENVSPK